MVSITRRSLILGGSLLGALACAAKTHPSAEEVKPGTAKPFGDLADMVFANEEQARQGSATGYVRYPDAERNRGVEATFAVAFVLDPTGRPEYPSVSFIGNAAPSFFAEVCRFLRGARYKPVHRDGLVRRALVVSDFTFTLEPQNPTESRVHVQPVNVEQLRRMFIAKGLAESVNELETYRHCP
jgi:TonB family protein